MRNKFLIPLQEDVVLVWEESVEFYKKMMAEKRIKITTPDGKILLIPPGSIVEAAEPEIYFPPQTKKDFLKELLQRELDNVDYVDENKLYKRISEIIRSLGKILTNPPS